MALAWIEDDVTPEGDDDRDVSGHCRAISGWYYEALTATASHLTRYSALHAAASRIERPSFYGWVSERSHHYFPIVTTGAGAIGAQSQLHPPLPAGSRAQGDYEPSPANDSPGRVLVDWVMINRDQAQRPVRTTHTEEGSVLPRASLAVEDVFRLEYFSDEPTPDE